MSDSRLATLFRTISESGLREIQRWFLLYVHVERCLRSEGEENGIGAVHGRRPTGYATMRDFWLHARSCRDPVRCETLHCGDAKALIPHVNHCRDAACRFCGPIKVAVRQTEGGRRLNDEILDWVLPRIRSSSDQNRGHRPEEATPASAAAATARRPRPEQEVDNEHGDGPPPSRRRRRRVLMCPVCLEKDDDYLERGVVSTGVCDHVLCGQCMEALLRSPVVARCPLCRQRFERRSIRRIRL